MFSFSTCLASKRYGYEISFQSIYGTPGEMMRSGEVNSCNSNFIYRGIHYFAEPSEVTV